MSNEEDREDALYHGTTLDVVQEILALRRFELRETFFGSTRALAALFARRSSRRRGGEQRPALVRVVLYASDLTLWKRNRIVRATGFDDADLPALRGQTQLIFSAEGIRFLNRDMFPGELIIEPNDAR